MNKHEHLVNEYMRFSNALLEVISVEHTQEEVKEIMERLREFKAELDESFREFDRRMGITEDDVCVYCDEDASHPNHQDGGCYKKEGIAL